MGISARLPTAMRGWLPGSGPALFDRVEQGRRTHLRGPATCKRRWHCSRSRNNQGIGGCRCGALAFVRTGNRQKGRRYRLLLGGLLAWLSATRLHPDAAVGYYAGASATLPRRHRRLRSQLHFGKLDTHIPAEQVEKVHAGILRWRFIGMRARDTVSIAIGAAASCGRRGAERAAGRSHF